jgi:hypothetical protein
MSESIPSPVQLVVETFGPQFTAIAERYAETVRETGDWCLPLVHFRMASEFYSTARAVLETTPVSEVEAVETVLDFGIDWLKLVKSYLRIVLDGNR